MRPALVITLSWLLSFCDGQPVPRETAPRSTCVESVHVVAPGYDASCPWGLEGRVTPTSDGNIAFHCMCPKEAPKEAPKEGL